jgi:hypothetical protein
MFNTNVGAGAVGAGAASRYGSGSDQIMRFRLGNTVMYTYDESLPCQLTLLNFRVLPLRSADCIFQSTLLYTLSVLSKYCTHTYGTI